MNKLQLVISITNHKRPLGLCVDDDIEGWFEGDYVDAPLLSFLCTNSSLRIHPIFI